jgi:hypothetical protein
MAQKRFINTRFWDDSYIVDLDPIEKLLFMYCLSNPLTNIAGIYEITARKIAFDTGIDKDMVLKVLGRFQRDGKMVYKDDYLIIVNFVKHQTSNPSVEKGIKRVFSELPQHIVDLYDSYTNKDSLGTDCVESGSNYTLLNLTKPNLTKPNGEERGSGEPLDEEPLEKSVQGIPEVIKEFEPINQQAPKWYGNKTQRKACGELIEANGLDNVISVVRLLPKTNQMDYMPVITTPYQLAQKWSSLAAALQRKKNNQTIIF